MLIRVDKHTFLQDTDLDCVSLPIPAEKCCLVGPFSSGLCGGISVSARYLGEPVGSLVGSQNHKMS